MPGLLDWDQREGPSTGLLGMDRGALAQGLLGAAFGAMAGRGTRLQALGTGGLSGLLAYSQAIDRKQGARQEDQAQQYRDLQMQAMQAQLAEQQRAGKQRETDQSAWSAAFAPTTPQQALQGGGGPTVSNAAQIGQMPAFDPRQMFSLGASPQAVSQAVEFNQALNPAPKLRDVAPGAMVIDERTGKTVFQAPAKPEALPNDVREYQFAVGQGYKGSFADWDVARRRAGASSISVSTGQKGFDNTLKLRGDFRSEPVYKAHQEMSSAYAQIKQSLKQASPAGDLAGATKIMKLLDPGSVVRESELGMAMAASGLLDRVENYATNILKGTKLTPTQRQDFQRLADALYAESVKGYNAKRGEYQGIAERNQLSVPDVLGPESVLPQSSGGGWSIKPKGQ